MRKTTSISSLPRAAAVGVMALLFAVTGQQASAQDLTNDDCHTAFEGAPAIDYCQYGGRSDLVAGLYIRMDAKHGEPSRDRCSVRGRCTITVKVGETDKRFEKGLPNQDVAYTLAEVGTLDLCFSRHGEASNNHVNRHDGWRMDVTPGCGDGIDSATAVSDGLSLDGS